MGVSSAIRGIYTSLEDGYYGVLDRIQDLLPVYSVVDPIDRIFPSFVLVLLLLAGGIAFVALNATGPLVPTDHVFVNVVVENRLGEKVPNAPLSLTVNGARQDATTDSDGFAVFNVPKNSTATLSLSLDGYTPIEETIFVSDQNVARRITLQQILQPQTRVIQFADSSGRAVSGETITVKVRCSDSSVSITPDTYSSDTQGQIRLTQPAGCGTLQATVISPAKYTVQPFALEQPSTVIRLEAVDTPVGKVRVRVTDESDNLLDETEIDGVAVLYQDSSETDRQDVSNGYAVFSGVPVGTYYVSVIDNRNRYAAKKTASFSVKDNQQTLVTAVLARSIQQSLSVHVEDSDTLFGIEGARVALVSRSSGQESFSKTTDSAGVAVFSLSDAQDWTVEASADGHLPARTDIRATDRSVTIELDKASADNTGTVEAIVQDEDGHAVENAKVRLRFDDTKTFAPYDALLSDVNGRVKWTGVKGGEKMFAYAEKFPATGTSASREIVADGENAFQVQMEIGDTALQISASTEDNELIPSSTAELFDADGSSLGEIPLSDGTGSTTLKADKRVFLVVRNDAYFAYQTETFQLFKDSTIKIDAKLPSRLVSGGPRVTLVGVFNDAGEIVDQMEAGNNYLVRLQLKIPEDSQYAEAGVHFRVGNQSVTQNDSISIKQVNVANAVLVEGTTFNPPRGAIIDLNPANTTTGDAKWANVSWSSPEPQVYSMAFEVRVKSSAPLNAPIPLFYRAWAKSFDNRILRDPLDNELGEASATARLQDLYANAYPVSRYFEGTGSTCDQYFCYSNVRVFDSTQGLYLPSPFSLTVNRDYNFSFSVQNASVVNLTGAKLIVSMRSDGKESEDLAVSRYEFRNASAQAFSGNSMPKGHAEFDVGSLVVNAGMTGTITFRPQKTVPGSILLQTVYNGEIVSSREIALDVSAEKKLSIELSPDPIPAFIDVPATVTLTEEGNLEPVEGADVKVERKTVDRTTMEIGRKASNGLGKADFVIPASAPRTLVTVTAKKSDYASEPLVRMVDDNVLAFSPSTLAFALKSPSTPEAREKVIIENRTKVPIRLSRLQLVGDFAGILDVQKINGFLSTLEGTSIPAESQKEIEVRAFLSSSATFVANQSIDASLAVQAVDAKLSAKWVFAIPVKIAVLLDGVPENESCLSVDEPEWSTTSLEGNLDYAFTLTNNCRVEGKPLALGNLSSQIKWSTNAVGNVELTLTDASNPNNAITQVLRPDDWVNLFDHVPQNAAYYGVLRFVPKNNKSGSDARFTVDFAGETPTDEGPKKLTTREPISADLLITNLSSCIQYSASGGGPSNLAQLPTSTTNETENQNTSTNTTTGNAKDAVENTATGFVTGMLQAISGNSTTTSATGDELFTTVKIGTGEDAKLTIDISGCGNIAVDFALCKDDDYCRGGTIDGGITVKPNQFTLTADTPVREITVSRQEVPGIYGLEVSARTKGGVYNPVATIDVLIDPKTDEQYFTLSKYELLVKGIGTRDSALLKNTNYVTTTTIQAAAADWAKKKSPKDNGLGSMLPLLGAAMLPQMLPVLLDPLQGAFQGARDTTQNKTKAYKTAKDDTKDAREKADALKKNYDKELDSGAVDSLNQTLSGSDSDLDSAFEDGDALCDQIKTSLATCMQSKPPGTCPGATADATTQQVDKCKSGLSDMKSSIAEPWNGSESSGASQKFKDAQKALSQTTDQTGKAYSGFPSANFPSGAQASSTYLNAAKTTKSNVCPLIGGCSTGTCSIGASAGALQSLESAGTSITDGLAGVDEVQESLSTAQDESLSKITDSVSSFNGSCGCDAEVKAIQDGMKSKVGDKLADAKKKVKEASDKLKDKFDPARGADFQAAKKELDTAGQSCNAAVTALEDQGNATPVLSDHASGINSAALSNILSQGAMLGLMAGAMGNSFSADPSATDPTQAVAQPQQVFAINLPSDSRGLTLDQDGLKVAFDAKHITVTGKTDLGDQRVPLTFENIGLESDQPVYTVMTIGATEHLFDPITKIPFGDARFASMVDSWGLGQFFGKAQNYEQRFHLRAITKDTLLDAQPQVSEQFACTQGAMVGQTGPDALPRVKLSWNWTDITADTCDAQNPDYAYCDATQFSIMMTKRLQVLREFLAANPALPCPHNWLSDQLQAELDPFNQYLVQLDYNAFNAADLTNGCWMPKSTKIFDDRSALEYYVEDADNVAWTDEVPNTAALHDLLFFDAYLIQDGYSEDFRNDFSRYYSDALLDAPPYFAKDPTGANWSRFFDTGALSIEQKFTGERALPTSGLYHVDTVADFGDTWDFFSSDGTPAAQVSIELLALRQSGLNNVFYYLPFDGMVGMQGAALERQGYGIGYDIVNNEQVVLSRQTGVTTLSDAGSNPVQRVTVSSTQSFDSLNAFASTRGFLLDIQNSDTATKSLRLTPTLATPVLLKVHNAATPEPFGAFYTLRNSDIPQNLGGTAAYWSGAGACLDFSGNLVADAWDYRPDRHAVSSDHVNGWQFAYGVGWPKADTPGDVYLKTVIYSPVTGAYSLNAASDNVTIATPDASFRNAVDLRGISNMAYNRAGNTASDRISAIDDLFELVKAQQVCVTNTGVATSFWWNPKTVYSARGSTGSSIADLEATLQSGRTCR